MGFQEAGHLVQPMVPAGQHSGDQAAGLADIVVGQGDEAGDFLRQGVARP